MRLFSLEFSRPAYYADFAVYGAAIVGLATFLSRTAPVDRRLGLGLLVLLGLVLWTLVEYGVHRFLMHGVDPIRRWHGEHHRRPEALLGSPTLLSAAVVVGVLFLPAWLCADTWFAAAVTLGFVTGLFLYGLAHHAIHHSSARSAWLQRRTDWHERHHRLDGRACYGVTTGLWDHVFGSAGSLPVIPSRLAARVGK